MRAQILLSAFLFFGCDAFEKDLPALYAARPQTDSTHSPSGSEPNQLAQMARRLKNRWKPPALPALGSIPSCDRTETPSSAATGDGKRLVLANVDVRPRTKNLIPRRVSERLESGESALLATLLDDQTHEAAAAQHRNVPASALSLTADDLAKLTAQRYFGVFYVTEYQGPALILRVGEIRREWFAGSIGASFVLYDTEQQRPICASALRARNDVKSAPIRSRLQAETRSRLERELGDALRFEAERVTQGLSGAIDWPETRGGRAVAVGQVRE